MRSHFFLLLFCILAVTPAWATSFVPMADETLLQQAPVVILGKVLGGNPAANDDDSTDYLVQVTEALKGSVAASPITVRVLGSYDRRKSGLIVPGAPRFSQGEGVLLFLAPEGDHYLPQQFMLGAFHQRSTADGKQVLQRDLSQAEEFSADGRSLLLPAQDQARDLGKFRSWLRSRAQGRQADSNYWSAPATAPGDTVTKENFTTLGTPPARWFEFDGGTNIAFFANQNGQTDLSGGGFTQFVTGLQAWDEDTGSNIRYVYGGKTTAHGGLKNGDGVNAILFNDPNNEITGSFDCNNGGVLAQGGFRAGDTRTYKGTVFQTISEVDIVVNDGTGCFMAGHGGKEAAEVYAHEIGHSLGLGHSCGDNSLAGISDCSFDPSADDALMRATPHGDGRGASLRADDQAGVAYLYPDNGMPPPAIDAAGVGGSNGGSGGGGGGAVDPAMLVLLASAAIVMGRRRLKGYCE